MVAVASLAIFAVMNTPANTGAPTANQPKTPTRATLEEEAVELLSTDPATASKKFAEAEESYQQAGNEAKASEMRDNKLSADQSAATKAKLESETPPPITIPAR